MLTAVEAGLTVESGRRTSAVEVGADVSDVSGAGGDRLGETLGEVFGEVSVVFLTMGD